MTIIGDVHGKVLMYQDIIQSVEESIQIGDFGFVEQHEWHKANVDGTKHKILLGNHDCTLYKYSPHSLGDFGVYKDFFFIRGADSIDKGHRVFGRDWWADEELDWKEWNDCIKLYEQIKPSIVLSHDCPSVTKEVMFGYKEQSFTNRGLQQLFEIHQPDLWIFGHYHRDTNDMIENTLFICLDELSTYNL